MSSQIETIVNAYKTLSKIPSVVSARVGQGGRSVQSTWSVRDVERGRTVNYACQYMLDDTLSVLASSDFGADVTNELLSAVSPCEQYRAVIREEKDKDNKKHYLEVWAAGAGAGGALSKCVELGALEIHGDVYADSEFGCLSWSADSGSVSYVAERKPRRAESYCKRRPQRQDAGDTAAPQPEKGTEHVYKQDWGEQLVGKHLSVAVTCRLQDETFTVVEGLPEDCCPGQVSFTPSGDLVGCAWRTEPRRLGLIFCTNRPGFVFRITPQGEMTQMSVEGLAVRSTRVSPSGAVVWLQRAAAGPHHAAHQIALATHGQKEPKIVVDIVNTVTETANKRPFHGVYCTALPRRCFSADGGRLAFSTPHRNEIRSYVVDLDDGRLVDISLEGAGSTSVLDVYNDVIIAVRSSITSPHQLYAARLPARGSEESLQWKAISAPLSTPQPLSDSAVEYLELTHDDCDDAVKSFSAILCTPALGAGEKAPLVVWPHGGPHSAFANAYSLEAALFNLLGLASVQVNYRGSVGAGEASVGFLPGKVGDADVRDCHAAAAAAVQRPSVDKTNLFVFGGSHGGFLACHLAGQHPDMWRAIVCRNPVVDIASMYNSTDIPDWCAVEGGYEFTESGPASEEQLVCLRRRSPLAHAHRVRAPTALMLGAADKRVPHCQGLEFARRLKANGVRTKIYMYDDNHSLSSVPNEMDNLINSARWLLEHLQQ